MTISQVVGSIVCSITSVSVRPPSVWPISSRRVSGSTPLGLRTVMCRLRSSCSASTVEMALLPSLSSAASVARSWLTRSGTNGRYDRSRITPTVSGVWSQTLLDSSVLIAYLDRDDTLHDGAAEAIESALRSGSGLAIAAVSWAEILNGARQGHHDEAAVREFVADLGVDILPVTSAIAEQAAQLQAGYAASGPRRRDTPRLRTPDALILATGEIFEEVEQVLTGEPKWANVPGVTTVVERVKE